MNEMHISDQSALKTNDLFECTSDKKAPPLMAILNKLQNRFVVEERYDLAPYVHWKGSSSEPIHRWLRYREAYSPELIDKLELKGRILDPFSGCGSIMVGSAQRSQTSVGIDINPLSVFSTEVKLNRLNEIELSKARAFLRQIPCLIDNVERWPLPKLSISKKLFEPEIMNVILKTRTAIEKEFVEDQKLRDFFLLGWIETLEHVGNYYKEGNGIKYRNKRRSKGKYETIPDGEWQLKRFGVDQKGFALNKLQENINSMIEDVSLWKQGEWGRQSVKCGSAMQLESILANEDAFDSVIFSPPYANRFDYFEAFKVELWFGGFVDSYESLNKLRKQSLRSHLAADYRKNNPVFQELELFIDLMDKDTSSWRMGVADLLRGYFQDMQTVLTQCKKAAPNGRVHVVVGNSAFAGVIIPTDILTAIIGMKCGYDNVKILESRHLTVSPQQRSILSGYEDYMRESVVVFQ